MNLDDDEFDDLCKGFQTQNLNENIDANPENKMEIDTEVKSNESPRVLDEVNEENVSGKVEKLEEATYWCTLFKQDGSLEVHINYFCQYHNNLLIFNNYSFRYLSFLTLTKFSSSRILICLQQFFSILLPDRI
jgi:hypothetical protein